MKQRVITIKGYRFEPTDERIPLVRRSHRVWTGTIGDTEVLLVSWGCGALPWAIVRREMRVDALARSTTATRAVDEAWATLASREMRFGG